MVMSDLEQVDSTPPKRTIDGEDVGRPALLSSDWPRKVDKAGPFKLFLSGSTKPAT